MFELRSCEPNVFLWIDKHSLMVKRKCIYNAQMALLYEGLTPKDQLFNFQMGVPPIRVDVLMGIPGVNFEDCWGRRMEVDFDGLKVVFISKNDLIASKRAAGRPQDLIDADLLSDE